MSVPKIRIGANDYTGWTRVNVNTGIETACRSFSFSATAHKEDYNELLPFGPGDECEVYLDDDRIVTGYVDSTPADIGPDSHTVGVSGRSITQDLVDCSAMYETGQFLDQNIKQISQALADPYGVTVTCDEPGDAFERVAIQTGETVFDLVERLARVRGLLVFDDGDGNLVLARPGTTRATSAIEEGVNVETAHATPDLSMRYSEYTVVSQRKGSDDDNGKVVTEPWYTATDEGISRTRKLLLTAETQVNDGSCEQRAKWEASNRAGRSFVMDVTTDGWRQSNGDLWIPNTLVRVKVTSVGVNERELLIVSVDYSYGEDGTGCTLYLSLPKAYELGPVTADMMADIGGLE